MSKAIENLKNAMSRAVIGRPKVFGFPYLAEVLRQAGVSRNVWHLPSLQSLYISLDGPVVMHETPLVTGAVDVPLFSQPALIDALRTDQAGESTFPEFLAAIWQAGIVRYDVDLEARTVTYFGCNDEQYMESYPAITVE